MDGGRKFKLKAAEHPPENRREGLYGRVQIGVARGETRAKAQPRLRSEQWPEDSDRSQRSCAPIPALLEPTRELHWSMRSAITTKSYHCYIDWARAFRAARARVTGG